MVVTPSHNPPADGGFKYNPPSGGPAASDATAWIQDRANQIIAGGLKDVRRLPYARALAADTTGRYDFLGTYVGDLPSVLDLDAIRAAGVRIGADPLGGASVAYWGRIAEQHGIDLTVVNPHTDPTWRFMTLDWDGQIRMDCSSPHAMASLIEQRDRFRIATGNDADADRHGIVTPDAGLMNPNHYLAVAISYLFRHRERWPDAAGIGKTLVSSTMIDRVAADLGRRLVEVPVGFKWFVDGLVGGDLGFGGEESAGASFLRRDGSVWTTDKDGIILALLAAEITAVTDKTPSEHYAALTGRFGAPAYARIDAPATREQKALLGKLSPAQVTADTLAGEPVTAVLTEALATAPRSAASRSRPRTPGSPPGPRAPRTSTRCTPSPSSAGTTWRGCRRRPRPWCWARSAADGSTGGSRRGRPGSAAPAPPLQPAEDGLRHGRLAPGVGVRGRRGRGRAERFDPPVRGRLAHVVAGRGAVGVHVFGPVHPGHQPQHPVQPFLGVPQVGEVPRRERTWGKQPPPSSGSRSG